MTKRIADAGSLPQKPSVADGQRCRIDKIRSVDESVLKESVAYMRKLQDHASIVPPELEARGT